MFSNGTVDDLKKCFLSDEDRALYKGIMFSDDALLSEEKLTEIKGKSEFVYAVTKVVNDIIDFSHRHVGLSEGAFAFKRQVLPLSYFNVLQYLAFISPFLFRVSLKKFSNRNFENFGTRRSIKSYFF